MNELNRKFSCEKGGEKRLIEERRNKVDNHSWTPWEGRGAGALECYYLQKQATAVLLLKRIFTFYFQQLATKQVRNVRPRELRITAPTQTHKPQQTQIHSQQDKGSKSFSLITSLAYLHQTKLYIFLCWETEQTCSPNSVTKQTRKSSKRRQFLILNTNFVWNDTAHLFKQTNVTMVFNLGHV